jgi:hypothetical protein
MRRRPIGPTLARACARRHAELRVSYKKRRYSSTRYVGYGRAANASGNLGRPRTMPW